ncbi:3-oxoacyl-[acyl-carrier protein] reductase/meso-butanediol dehydrogenase / (S,S)-butanediol dehydrogenase / diacetyl reductase [Natronoarchaeum philippinense]|uniref:3-oxoacyl-[acyl-carrier protein] reductase/meso-butanediol dehydrogenase / (S,S)-butanediol dehydrogenase / diacetyl reductase n=1 Tax=Natronoarchaeum philippinense TaxID=558529 RepID=A0A285P0A8_NATPI|nr:SDR family NAD(P)-dependent oxidoreductase [Natronoarchaeum philippinense]SNZ15182.1 3-oxoacyl-[acyl-carrier protein] reductase/meso-butanediol dehydrogenase / (S,S)-butanediol dehydrogenase / diacetyl reductase [Natronoarchaeum philippinense]
MSELVDSRLAGRHVVVTGGARGIGRGIARRCARSGADISIFDLRPDVAEETADEVRDIGGAATVWKVDVTDADAVADAVEGAESELGPIDGLVNNAGVQQAISILETTEEDWDRHFGVNAKGTFLVSKHVAERMIETETAGSIVNVASVGAERPFKGQGAYGASKAAVVTFTTVLAKELAEHGITANSIKPGTIDTPMVQQWLEERAAQSDATEEELLAETIDEHVLDRIGTPEEIGHAAVLLLSEEGEWITGESIAVDGGYLRG